MKITLLFVITNIKNFVTKTVLFKKGSALVASLGLAITFNISSYTIHIPDSFFGISIGIISLLSILIIVDTFTGIIASRHLGNKIESGKLAFTFYKFLSVFLFFWLIYSFKGMVNVKINNTSSWVKIFYNGVAEIMEIISYSILLLLSFREWISIGENIEKRFDKKFYLFQIVEKIFDIIENKLIKWLENKDICK